MNKVKLSDIADIISGQSPKSEYYSKIKGTPFLQGNRTFKYKYPEIDTYTTKVTKLALKGDVLMSVRAPVGDLNIAPIDVCIGRGLMSLRAKDGDNEFLYYALKYNIENLIKQGSGTTYDSVNRDTVLDFDLIIPKNTDERKKIAKMLKAIDDKVEINKKLNDELEKMIKIIYNYWFTQFDFPNEKGNPYRSLGGNLIFNKDLNIKIPNEWKVVKLKEVFDYLEGPGITKDKYSDDGHKFINIKCINENDLNLSNASMIKYDYVKKYEQFLLKEDDVVVSTSGTLGRSAIVRGVHLPLMLNTSVIRFRAKDKKFQEFMYLYLKSDLFIEELTRSATGSIQKNFGPTHLDEISIFLPDDKTIEEFSKIVKPIMDKIKNNKDSNIQLVELKEYLLPLLMNGQVKFKDIEK